MNDQPYDPDQHDSQLVAVFERRETAERACEALLGAGLPGASIELVSDQMAEPSDSGDGFWHSLRRLFAPAEDARELGKALKSGRIMVVARPHTVSEREAALEILESCGPMDIEERDEYGRAELNHAALSRADMIATAPPHVSVAVESDVAAREATSTTYTYGVPVSVAQAMSAEEQVLAQAPAALSSQPLVRIVEERLRAGWRDRSVPTTRVRSYVAARDAQGTQRVELLEEEIGASADRPAA